MEKDYNNGLYSASSFKDDRKKMSIIQKIIRKSYSENWSCLCPGCHERAINTHLLQQNGILNRASNSHSYMELKHKDIFYWNEDEFKCKFEERGITQAISYPIFCSKHDSELFKNAEKESVDFDDYRTQLLFSFRTLCCDYRKTEIVLLQNKNMLEDGELNVNFSKSWGDYVLNIIDNGQTIGAYIEDLYNEILCPNNKAYEFKHYTLPKMDVYASACDYKNGIRLNGIEGPSICFIHVIPQQQSLEVIIGYKKNIVTLEHLQYSTLWNDLDKKSLEWMITELFANRTENCGIGKELYNKIPTKQIDRFRSYISENIGNGIEPKGIDFNLFEGVDN